MSGTNGLPGREPTLTDVMQAISHIDGKVDKLAHWAVGDSLSGDTSNSMNAKVTTLQQQCKKLFVMHDDHLKDHAEVTNQKRTWRDWASQASVNAAISAAVAWIMLHIFGVKIGGN